MNSGKWCISTNFLYLIIAVKRKQVTPEVSSYPRGVKPPLGWLVKCGMRGETNHPRGVMLNAACYNYYMILSVFKEEDKRYYEREF